MSEERIPPVEDNGQPTTPPDAAPPPVEDVPPQTGTAEQAPEDLKPRLQRLGGEPAPDITPEEFARLQEAGQIHIDPRGRVRTTRRDETDAGISLRKRRAWYAR